MSESTASTAVTDDSGGDNEDGAALTVTDSSITDAESGPSEGGETDKTGCWLTRVCHYCAQHLCLATAVSLCSAIIILITINIVFGFDPFLIILMFSLIFLLMTLLTG